MNDIETLRDYCAHRGSGPASAADVKAALERLEANAKALWAARVLWNVGLRDCAEHDKCPTPEVMHPGGPGWAVTWTKPGERVGIIYPQGTTPELAAIKAAEKLVLEDPSLDPSVTP